MEMEAVIQEKASLESQLASLGALISNLTSDVEEQKSKVSICIFMFIRSVSVVQDCVLNPMCYRLLLHGKTLIKFNLS